MQAVVGGSDGLPRTPQGDDGRGQSVLFIPVTAATGSGEYFQSLAVARALQRRYPAAHISFVVNRHAPVAADCPFARVLVDGSPTLNTAAVMTALDELKPDVVVFDGAARLRQLRYAKRLGARTVYVSSRPNKRRLGFRYRAMAYIDQHWIVQSGFVPRLSWLERFKLGRPPRVELVFLHALFPPPGSSTSLNLPGVSAGQPYLLFVPGGGGRRMGGRAVGEIFADAAIEAAQRTGLPTIALTGPNHSGTVPTTPGVTCLRSLPPGELITLLSGAHVVAVGCGTLTMQALALRRPCVSAVTGGSDQPSRHRQLRRHALALPVATRATAIADAVVGLCNNPPQREALVANIDACAVDNGLPRALDAIQQLLADAR